MSGEPSARQAVVVSGLTKTFRLPHERYTTVRDRLRHPLVREPDEVLAALRGVDFTVGRGECFGIVGKNGSGKSTLLRCLAGIYPVDAGSVAVAGRLVPFIELGVGFNPALAAKDNAILNAVILGLSRREAEARFADILAFAELERFVDQRLKNYSTGMVVRLAFAVSVHVDGDVLLYDEALAVGDLAFQAKCHERFADLRAAGRTIVLVSHSMQAVRELCDRALLLHQGEPVALGEAGEVADAYEELNEGRLVPRPARGAPAAAPAAAAVPRRILLGAEPARLLPIAWRMATTDFKLKYHGTVLNSAWAIGRPLALFGSMLLVFTQLGYFTNTTDHYPAYLLGALVLWTFFSQVTSGSVHSLADKADLLRKLPFPHLAVPLSVIISGLLDLGANLVVVLAFVLGSGILPTWTWLEVPLLLALLTALTAGISLLLSGLFIRYRDVNQLWQVASQTLFYLTPVFYAVSSVPGSGRRLQLLLNPVADVITQGRHAVIDQRAPTAAEVLGGPAYVLAPLAVVGGLLVLGLVVFARASGDAAENA